MEQPESKVEVSLREPRIQGFLKDLMELCAKYKATIVTDVDETLDETIVEFHNWDYCTRLEVNSEGASLYWPRIQTEIVIRKPQQKETSNV